MKRPRSLRVRITVAFALFFSAGAILLLSAAYVIVARSTAGPVRPDSISVARSTPATGQSTSTAAAHPSADAVTLGDDATVVPLAAVQAAQSAQSADDLRQVLWWFVAALVVGVGLSVASGWLVAGRALAPLRAITQSARAVSDTTLDARVALDGPRDELRELGDTFDAMLARLEASFAAQRRFVADAAHELRTPLALARTEAELAASDLAATPQQLREALTEIEHTMVRSGELVEALLQLAQAGATRPETTPLRLDELLQAACSAAQPAATTAGVTLQPRVLAPVTVDGHAALLRTLIDNLLANAITYNRPGGWVHIELRQDESGVRLIVANSGEPLPPATINALFEPFVRAEPSRSRRTGGAGLGLAIVRAVAIAHGGTVTAHAPQTGGLEITVTLTPSI
jgi:signal transduction histidine kinase